MDVKNEATKLLANFNSRNDVSFWEAIRKKILMLILEDDINRFLNWEPITNTMNVSRTGYAGIELNDFKDNGRYFNLTKESAVGTPIHSTYLPHSSDNLIHNIYHIKTFEKELQVEIQNLKSIFEFGGGYGLLAKLIKQLGFTGKYTIFDFPEFGLIQKFYLNSHNIKVLHQHSIEESQVNVDLFIGNWSISETPLDFRNKVLESVKAKYYLLAFQDVFENISNTEYFTNFIKNTKDHKWKLMKINHLYGNQYYLLGYPNV